MDFTAVDLVGATQAGESSGTPDASFGANGLTTTNFAGAGDLARPIAVERYGKITEFLPIIVGRS